MSLFAKRGISVRSATLIRKKPNGSCARFGAGAAKTGRRRLNEILVDIDVVSYLLNRHSLAEEYERLLFGYVPMVSFITVAEMYRGAYKKDWGPRRMAELATHLRRFAIVPSSLQACLSHAHISNAAESHGRD